MRSKALLELSVLIVAVIAIAIWYSGSLRASASIANLRRERDSLRVVAAEGRDDSEWWRAFARSARLADDAFVSGIGKDGAVVRVWLSRSDSATILSTYDDRCVACKQTAPLLEAAARAAPCGARLIELLVMPDRRVDSLKRAVSHLRLSAFSLSDEGLLRLDVLPSVVVVGPNGTRPALFHGSLSPSHHRDVTDRLASYCG